MFSGIIAGTGTVKSLIRLKRSARLTVDGKGVLGKIRPGESISVNGACLTVTRNLRALFSADLSEETLKRTTLGFLVPGDSVNLEEAARFSDRIGGHWVTGHVDGIGRIRAIREIGEMREIRIDLPAKLLEYCIEKGSIAVDGVSLTINRVTRRDISVMIIPQTLRLTDLEKKKVRDPVNIENDMIAKYVRRFVDLK